MCCECSLSVPLWLWLLTTIGLIGAVLAVGLSIATHCGIHALAVAAAELVRLARGRGTVRLIGSILTLGIAVALCISVHTVTVAATELITGAACMEIKEDSISNRSD